MNKMLFLILSASILSLTSCKKENLLDIERAPADASIAKALFDTVKDEVDQQINFQSSLNGFKDDIAGPRGGCAKISITPEGNVFPKVVSISFPVGCTTFAGASIEGNVNINITGKVRENGTMASFSLLNFKYKNYTISGDYLVTFSGANGHITEITNGKVVTPTNKIITYTAKNIASQIEGANTTYKTNPITFLQDDVYSIESTSNGVNTVGNDFTLVTKSPLIYKVSCQWLTSGSATVTEDTRPKISVTIDYGNGICDDQAELNINGLVSFITLP